MDNTEKKLAAVLDWFLWTCRNTSQNDIKDERYRRYNDLVWSLRELGCSVHCDIDGKHRIKANALK